MSKKHKFDISDEDIMRALIRDSQMRLDRTVFSLHCRRERMRRASRLDPMAAVREYINSSTVTWQTPGALSIHRDMTGFRPSRVADSLEAWCRGDA